MTDNNQNSKNTDLPGTSDTNKTDQEPIEKLTDSSGTNHTDQDQVQNDLDSVQLALMVKACPDHLNNTVETAIDMCMEVENQKSQYILRLSDTELKNFIDKANATNNAAESEPVSELETAATNKITIEMAKPLEAETIGRKRHKKTRKYNLRPIKGRFVEQLNNRRKYRRKAGNNARQALTTYYGPGRRRGRVVNAYPKTSLRKIVKRRKANKRRKAGRPSYTHPHYGRGHRESRSGRGRPGHN